ncbi:MAG: laccase domain-containing protein [Spirochaetales bacterium]|nr:laccase domain-containing protein [Spirochaetales bacterium]
MPPLWIETLAGCRLGVIGRTPFTPGDPAQEQEFLAASTGMDKEQIYFLTQVHGVQCQEVQPGFSNYSIADAFFTTQRGAVLVIRTADCLPVFVVAHSPGRRVVALIHAGWRGMAQGIIGRTIDLLLAESPDVKLDVAFGPAISAEVYEVGPEVAQHFQAVQESGPGKYLLDLVAEARFQIPAHARIHSFFSACTLRDNRFYSHRRGDTGRNYSFIWMET